MEASNTPRLQLMIVNKNNRASGSKEGPCGTTGSRMN